MPRWLTLRRLSQTIFFGLFAFLLLRTEFRGYDIIRYPVNTFFRLDPLLGLTTLLSLHEPILHFWPALLTVLVTLLLGRVFCGWFCPMGALLDFTRPFLVMAAAGWQAAWFLDPFSIIARGFSVTVIPLFNFATTSVFDSVYFNLPFLRPVSEPAFSLPKEHVLTFEQQFFRWAWLPLWP